MPQIDIITGARRIRRWSDEEKASILSAAFAPGAVVKDVARRANISTGQLYTWRKQFLKKQLEGKPGFARVMVTEAASLPGPATYSGDVQAEPAASVAALTQPSRVPGPFLPPELPAIEIEARGNKVRIPGSMPPALAAAVLRALVRR